MSLVSPHHIIITLARCMVPKERGGVEVEGRALCHLIDLKGLMEFRYMAEVGAIHLRHGREHKSERV